MSGIQISKHYKKTMFGTDIIFTSDVWDENKILRLSFQPKIVGYTTEEYEVERRSSLMDVMIYTAKEEIEKMKKSGNTYGLDKYVQELEKAYSDVSTAPIMIPKGVEMNIFGIHADFSYDRKKGQIGTLERPAVLCQPTGRQDLYLAFPADRIWIDWLVINGTASDITDITAAQLTHRFYNERMNNVNSERRVWL